MVKKGSSQSSDKKSGKRRARSKTTKGTTKKEQTDHQINHLLVENFVGLQRAMTNLSIKFESLSNQISKLLEIYEISAKNFIELEAESTGQNNKELFDRINALMDQNKTLAKGLVLIDEKLSEKQESQVHVPQQILSIPQYQHQPLPPKNHIPAPIHPDFHQSYPIQNPINSSSSTNMSNPPHPPIQKDPNQTQQASVEPPRPKPLPRI